MKSILIPMVCLAILVPLHSVAEPGDTELISILADAPLVSTDPNGAADTSGGSGSLISASGRFVAFSSGASNLVPADTNRHMDVFVRDRATGATTRESVSSSGRQMYTTSFVDSVSGDGRYVSFSSQAQNLVPGDTNATTDVFLRDRATGTTRRVSLDSSGLQANGGSYMSVISRSGRYVAFRSSASNLVSGDTNGADDVFVHDQLSGTTERVSVGHAGQANQGSGQPSMSADGRYVAFVSAASNLVPGDTNARGDAFVRDRVAGTTSRISVDSTGAQSNSNTEEAVISDDGRFVAFSGGPGTRLLIRDRTAGVTIDPGLVGFGPGLSTDGRYMVFQSSSALVSDDSNALDLRREPRKSFQDR
jgi:Tol biopolymer transport system component